VLATDWITLVGTLFGTAEYETITADGDEPIVNTDELGKLETHEVGTTTGEDHELGTTTVAGTKTNDETLTDEIWLSGIDEITLFGTVVGTLV
jgi:hypothetical protein